MNVKSWSVGAKEGFNPLNQVYVFNEQIIFIKFIRFMTGFNPLNQVYVFNS